MARAATIVQRGKTGVIVRADSALPLMARRAIVARGLRVRGGGIARVRVPALRAATVRRVRTGVRDPIRARGGGRAGVAQAANPPQSARSLSCKKRVTLAVNRSG